MKEFIGLRLKVRLHDIEGDRFIGDGELSINNSSAILRIDGSLELNHKRELAAVLPNSHILLLIDLQDWGYFSASYLHYKEFKVFEVIELEQPKWSDKISLISCGLPLLAEWFNRGFYKLAHGDESLRVDAANEKLITVNVSKGRLSLIQDVSYKTNLGVQLTPRFSIQLSFSDLILRQDAVVELKKYIDFFQFCFTHTIRKSGLIFKGEYGIATSISENFPFQLINDENKFNTDIIRFKQIESDLASSISQWESKYDHLGIVTELLLDAVENPVASNRFLSAIRSLEMLTKKDKLELDPEGKAWKTELEKLGNEDIAKWLICLLVKYRTIFKMPSKTWPISINNTRNFLTHRRRKGNFVFEGASLQNATNFLYGLAKSVVATEIGMSADVCKCLSKDFHFNYHNLFIHSEHSSFKKLR